jgi:hypothetical protein
MMPERPRTYFGAVFLLCWFLLVLTLSLTGWFERFSSATLFGFGAGASAAGFAVLHWRSEKFRGYVRARGLKRFTQLQVLRFYGTMALFKAHDQILPLVFAIPTGVMDVLLASTSFLVAARLVSPDGHPKPGFFAWHIAGLASLAISAILAILTSPTRFGLLKGDITSQPMTWFPMSLVPVFIGPVVLIFHLLALTAAHSHYGEVRQSR